MGQVGYDGYQTSDSTADLIPKLQRRIAELEEALRKIAYGQFTRWECQQIARDIVMKDE